MMHRLFEARVALLEHLPVGVDHVDARLAVTVGFVRVVEDAQRDVARPAHNVDSAEGPVRAGAQERQRSPSRGGARLATWRRS